MKFPQCGVHCFGCLLLENSKLNGRQNSIGVRKEHRICSDKGSPGSSGFSQAVGSDLNLEEGHLWIV